MTAPLPLQTDVDASFDLRWARWQERGAAGDRTLNRRAVVCALLACAALTTWLVLVIVA
jgi:hypothetical protein